MKQRFRKLLSLAAAGVLAAALYGHARTNGQRGEVYLWLAQR